MCEISVLTNHQGAATKTFQLDEAGQLHKSAAAEIYEGEVDRVSVSGLKGLQRRIEGLAPNKALCFGVAERQKARLLTQEALRSGSRRNRP